ncbi:MAG: hypothetical protein JXB47_06875 [Anaerolineae bacterium]|nr:hypothetical protein [Anaerolineae bacterium]
MDIPMIEPVLIEQENQHLKARLRGERLKPRQLRGNGARYGVVMVGAGRRSYDHYGQLQNAFAEVALSPEQARQFAARLLALADAAEARARLAEELAAQPRAAVLPEAPRPGLTGKWAVTPAQRTLRTLLGKARLFLDGDFRGVIAASFDDYVDQHNLKAWTPRQNAWYRELKRLVSQLHATLSLAASDDDFLDVDALVADARTTHDFLKANTWRASWLAHLGRLDEIQAAWSQLIAALEAGIRAVEAERAAQPTVPAAPIPYPPLKEELPI